MESPIMRIPRMKMKIQGLPSEGAFLTRQRDIPRSWPERRSISRPGQWAIALLLILTTGFLAEDAKAIRLVCGNGRTGTFGSLVPQTVCWYEDDPRPSGHAGDGRGDGGGGKRTLSPAPSAKEQQSQSKLEKASRCGELSGNPVVLSTGNKVEPELDFSTGGEMGLYLQRTYNAYWGARGLFGNYWLSNFDYTLVPSSDGRMLWAQRPDGRRIKYLLDDASGHYLEEKAGPIAYVIRESDGSYQLHNEDNGIERYSAAGYILSLRNEQGVGWNFTYSNNYLQQVVHSSGRTVKFVWSDGVVSQVIDPAGNVYRYSYVANVFGSGTGQGRLASATLPGTPETTISYHYEDNRFPGALTGKSFNGVRYSTFAYDDQGRAISTEHAGGVERFSFRYVVAATQAVTPPPKPTPPGGFVPGESNGYCDYKPGGGRVCYQPKSVGGAVPMSLQASAAATSTTKDIPKKLSVTETSPLGRETTYVYVDDRLIEVSGNATSHCPASYKEKTYDANGYEDIVSDFSDNYTDFDYDPQGHLLKKVEAKGTSTERTTTYAWDTTNNRLVRETVVGDHEVRYEYTSDGRIAKETVADLTQYGQGRSQVTTYGYSKHSNGLLSRMVIDGPLPGSTDAVTYDYSSTGDLVGITNGLGHKTTYEDYNGLGLPGKVTGPNGDVTQYGYDARGRVTARTDMVKGASQTTSYSYTGAGKLAAVRRPDGVTRQYLYDAALRVAEEFQARNGGAAYERKRYQYNNASQPVRVEVLDTAYPGNTQIVGNIDGVDHDGNWNWYVSGWACSTAYAGQIDVHLYAGGAAGSGQMVTSARANLASEPAVAQRCQTNGTAYRFRIPLSLDARQRFGGKSIYVHGISPAGSGNLTIGNSGTYKIPAAPVIGEFQGVERDADWNYFAKGWACAVGEQGAIEVQAFVGGGAGVGTYVASVRADQPADAAVATSCQTPSQARAFRIPLGIGLRGAHAGKGIFLIGKAPNGNIGDQQLANSGTQGVPAIAWAAEVVGWSGVGMSMFPGQTSTVKLTMRNTGNVVWGADGTGNTYLARGTYPTSLNVAVALPGRVAPGQEAVFSWTFTAPRPITTTSYHMAAQMATDGTTWGPSTTAVIQVEGSGGCVGTRCTQPRSIDERIILDAQGGAQ